MRAALRARRGPVAAVSGAVVLGGIAAGVWPAATAGSPPATAGHGGGSPAASAAGAPPAHRSPGLSASGGTGGGPSEPAASDLPDGVREVRDPKGFTIAVPERWTRSEQGASVFYTSADGASLLQVFTVTEKSLTPEEAAEAASQGLSKAPGYRQISLGQVPSGPENPTGDAAELVYAYDSESTGSVREGIERVFTAVDGRKYAVLVAAPQDRMPVQHTLLAAALSRFAPVGAGEPDTASPSA
ncbi:hypothetical protein [Streptomyces sp. NRRL F-5126]|uniref:hypothetical protein n=1 Tax=Streptomyces sp. NRRL F-5126 TaxID=1463857 RepID=UPI000692023F|nr:hypothetical protein [Streptomyces sp. NRRL F-5126]